MGREPGGRVMEAGRTGGGESEGGQELGPRVLLPWTGHVCTCIPSVLASLSRRAFTARRARLRGTYRRQESVSSEPLQGDISRVLPIRGKPGAPPLPCFTRNQGYVSIVDMRNLRSGGASRPFSLAVVRAPLTGARLGVAETVDLRWGCCLLCFICLICPIWIL